MSNMPYINFGRKIYTNTKSSQKLNTTVKHIRPTYKKNLYGKNCSTIKVNSPSTERAKN